jgi:hypothetical protein
MNEEIKVPLVIYVDGMRKVIGEAVIKGDQIEATIGEDAGQEVLEMLAHPTSSFSISYDTTRGREEAAAIPIPPRVPPHHIADKLQLYGKALEELRPEYQRRQYNLEDIPFSPDQRLREFTIKEPNWWEGLKMDPTHEEEK